MITTEKAESLSAVDAESGLVAFMLAAVAMGENNGNLNWTYELLEMKPDILLQFLKNASLSLSNDSVIKEF